MDTLKESPCIKNIAYEASRLQYGAMAELLSAIHELKNCPNKDFLQTAIEKLNEAWSISQNKMSEEDFEHHPSDWEEIFDRILAFTERDFEKFFRWLAHFLNNDAEKDFEKGRYKLVKIILTGPNSVVSNLRKTADMTTCKYKSFKRI